MKMFKKVTGLAVVGLLALGLTTHKAEAAYRYIGSDSMGFTVVGNDAGNKPGGVHKSTGGSIQIRVPAHKVTKNPPWYAAKEMYVTLYEMDGTKKQLIDQWVYRSGRANEAHTITKDISKYKDGTHAELKAYYHTNYSTSFTAKWYD